MRLTITAIIFIINILYAPKAFSQCSVPVTTYPYREDFETDEGNWIPGGLNSDWAWGIPAKTNINFAGTGTKCWVTGGLTGNSYKNGQRSWLQSPCFDFTSLPNPVIYFKIFWDTERNFDGAGFQYSLNNGSTWNNIGSAGAPSSCLTANWYNDGGIVYLGDPGWSGNTQPSSGTCVGGFGSWGWLVAQHDLAMLAGKPNVIFRFTFGAGTACNAYNGVAIDDINIMQATPGIANFTYSCNSNRKVSFLDSSSLCAGTFSWNFGDPASGSNNTSSLKDPAHVFSSAGTFIVTQTVTFPAGPPSVKVKTITILDANLSSTGIRCFGENNGTASVNVTGGSGAYNYSWNTVPVQSTPAISGLGPGMYIVTVGGTDACTIIDTAVITGPPPLKLTLQNTPEKCNNDNGALTASVTGGTSPYTYQWSNGNTNATMNGLQAGSYSLHLADANNCVIDSAGIVVINYINPVKAALGNDTTICPGETLVLSPGSFSSYRWQDHSTAPEFTVTQTGNYTVEVKDADGCTSSDAIYVEVLCVDIYFPTGFTPNHDGKNDGFGPGGKLGGVTNYTLRIYSRMGDIVFQTNDPYRQWDGRIKNLMAASGSYVWTASYEVNGRKKSRKGTLVLIK